MNTIDFSLLPRPAVIEELSYEAILTRIKDRFKTNNPDLAAALDYESEPITKLMESASYEVLFTRQRINDAAHAVMLAYAIGNDLDNLAAYFGVSRQLINEGDPDAVPPVPPQYEADERFRSRIQIALEGFSTAGPAGAYIFHALSADPKVKDVAVQGPPDVPDGEVLVTVLSTEENGVPTQNLLDTVSAALNDERIRPLTDKVTVQGAQVVSYQVHAVLTFWEGPDPELVRQQAEQSARAYIDARHRVGHDITLSGLFASLHREGVQNVELLEPIGNIIIDRNHAAYCTRLQIEKGGTGE